MLASPRRRKNRPMRAGVLRIPTMRSGCLDEAEREFRCQSRIVLRPISTLTQVNRPLPDDASLVALDARLRCGLEPQTPRAIRALAVCSRLLFVQRGSPITEKWDFN